VVDKYCPYIWRDSARQAFSFHRHRLRLRGGYLCIAIAFSSAECKLAAPFVPGSAWEGIPIHAADHVEEVSRIATSATAIK
jgi:hypothetical protein